MQRFQLTSTNDDTVIHRANAGVKLALLFVCSLGIAMAQTWVSMGIFAALIMVCAACARLSPRVLLVSLIPVAVLAACAFGFGIWNHPSPAGVSTAGIIAVRMLLVVEASFIVCLTTTSVALMNALEKLLNPLRHIRVPVKLICFILSLSLSFIPYITREFFDVRSAQRARGATMPGIGMQRRLANISLALSATFIGMFRHGEMMARALDARCFGLLRS